MLDEAKQATLGEEVFGQMLDAIYRGDLAPGAAVNESALAARFGVSRGPVREAVRRLQGIQLVTREPFAKARVVELTPHALVELFQMREALEGYAARLAAAEMKSSEIEDLSRELEAGHRPAGERPLDFHERVARASGNARLVESLCGDLYHLCRMYRRMSGSMPERPEEARTEHWQILQAIRLRDGGLAESLMRSHIQRAAQNLLRQLPGGSRLATAA